MLTIYKTAFSFVGRHPAFFLVLSVLMFTFTLVSERFLLSAMVGLPAGLTAWSVIVYLLHRALMFDEVNLIGKTKSLQRPKALGRFLFVSCALMAIIVLFTVALFVFVLDGVTHMQSDPLVGIGGFVVTFGIAYLTIMCCFGTSLPAAAAADRWGPHIALQRARATWWRMLLGLLIGPGLCFVVGVGTILAIENNFGGTGFLGGRMNVHDPAGLLVNYLIDLGSLFQSLLTVTVLKLAYERVAPIEVQTAMGILEDKAEVFA